MNIQEAIISRTYENKFREFFITLKIKPSDITLDEREACRAACELGTLMEGNLEKFQVEEETQIKKPETIYQRFKRSCIDYSGEAYYSRLKQHLGVNHIRNLEGSHRASIIEDVLKCQIWLMEDRKLGFNTNPPQWMISGLIHKDNALLLWHELFDDFNNPQK